MLWIAFIVGILCVLCSKQGDLRLLGGAILLVVAGFWIVSFFGWIGGFLPSLPSLKELDAVLCSAFDFFRRGLVNASYVVAIFLFLLIAGPLQLLFKLLK